MVKRVARKREVERGGKRSKGNGKRKIPRSRGWFEEKGRGGVAVKGGNRIRSEERKPLANPLNSGLLDTDFPKSHTWFVAWWRGRHRFPPILPPSSTRSCKYCKIFFPRKFQRFCPSSQSCYPAKLCKIISLEIFPYQHSRR